MRANRICVVLMGVVLVLGLAACGGGGGGGGKLGISSINLNPGTAVTGSVVQLTATFTGTSTDTASLIKNWTVSAGTVVTAKPDFSLLLRSTAKAGSASSASTTAGTVYWITPTTGATATISLSVEGAQKSREVSVTASPVSLSVADGDSGKKVCTVRVTNITDLYQAAFRVNFSSAWTVESANPGDFLGPAEDILWLGMLNQSGFVPCAITKKGSVPGSDGTGTLATITFAPKATTAINRGASAVPFEVGLVMLRDSKDTPISVP